MIIAIAIHDYNPPPAALDAKLSLKKGDKLKILKQDPSGWWHGVKLHDSTQHGWFPASYTKIVPNTEDTSSNGNNNVSTEKKSMGMSNSLSNAKFSSNSSIDADKERYDDDDDYGDMKALQNQIKEYENQKGNRTSSQIKNSASIDGDHKNVPANWNYAKTVDGRKYLYNHVTNRTVWRLEDISKLNEQQDDNISIPGMDEFDFKSLPTSGYDEYIMDVVNSISRLNEAMKHDQRTRYFRYSRKIVQSIQNLFIYTNNTNYDLLPRETSNLLKATSIFVLTIKTARNIWPPPDAKRKAREAAGNILRCVKAYVEGAKANGANLDELNKSATLSRNRDRHDSTSEEADAVVKVDEYAAKIKFTVDSLLDFIQKTAFLTNQGSEKSQANVAAQWRVIQSTSEITKNVGEILAYLDEYQMHTQFQSLNVSKEAAKLDESSGDLSPTVIEHRLGEYRDCHENVTECLSLLMAAASVAGEPFAPANATREVLIKMSSLLRSVKELIVIFKKLLACKDIVEEKQLYQKIRDFDTSDDRISDSRSTVSEVFASGTNFQRISFPTNSRKPSYETQSQSSLIARNTSEMSLSSGMRPRDRATGLLEQNRARMSMITDYTKAFEKGVYPGTDPNISPNSRLNSVDYSPRSQSTFTKREAEPERSRRLSKTSSEISTSSGSKLRKFFGEDTGAEEAKKKASMSQSSTPWYLTSDFSKEELIFTMDTNSKVKYAVPEAIIAHLTSHNSYDSEFTTSFLYTFRLFMEPIEFCRYLNERFNIEPPVGIAAHELSDWHDRKRTPIRLRVVKTLKRWVEEFWYHDTDKVALQSIRRLTKDSIEPIFPREGEKILDLCNKREKADPSIASKISLTSTYAIVSNDADSRPLPAIPRVRLTEGGKAVLDIDPAELARQLTLIESRIFLTINPVEVLYYKPDDKTQELKMRQMISESNQITGWVAETILIEKDIKKRANLIRHFIKVAERCHSVKNYATRQSVLAALHSTPIFRLKKTWEIVPAKAKTAFETLSKLMDRENNFMTYRHTLKSTIPPCVPFLGLYLTDVIFIKQGNPDKLSGSRLLNFDKYAKLAAIVDEINRFQSATYQFVEIEEMLEDLGFLLKNSRDIQELHDLSLQIEPREKAIVRSTSHEHVDEQEQVIRSLIDKGFI